MANANDGINTIATGFKNIFLAGVGAMALTGERTKELVDQLVAKGEITVEQGKQVTADLQQKATAAAKDTREDVLKAIMNTMTPEEREEGRRLRRRGVGRRCHGGCGRRRREGRPGACGRGNRRGG